MSKFKILSIETIRQDTYVVSIDLGKRDGEIRVTVYPAPLPPLVTSRNTEMQWLASDLSDSQMTKIRRAIVKASR